MRSSYLAGAIGAAAAVLVAGACGGSGDDSSNGSGSGGKAASSAGGIGPIITGGNGGGSAAGGGPPRGDACAGVSYSGERIPLDMFIMMDKSGSMSGQNGQNGGNNVWVPITDAIKQFVGSPQSALIGAGLGYFPITATSCQQ